MAEWTRLPFPEHQGMVGPLVNKGRLLIAGTGDSGVLRSPDLGETWRHANTGLPNLVITDLTIGKDGTIYLGGRLGVYRSIDDAMSWQPINDGLGQQSIFVLVTAPDGAILAGTENDGVYRLPPDGNKWSSLGLHDSTIWAVTIDSSGTIYASTPSEGVHRRLRDHDTWEWARLAPERDGFTINAEWMVSHPGGTVIATGVGDVFTSIDSGTTWQMEDHPIPDDDLNVPIAIDDQGNLFAGSDQTYISTDAGRTWRPWSNAISKGLAAPDPVYRMAQGPDRTLFAGTWDSKIFRTTRPSSVENSERPGQPGSQIIHPNPTMGAAICSCSLPRPSDVRVSIHDLLGRPAISPIHRQLDAGHHDIPIDLGLLPSGSYVLRIEATGLDLTEIIVVAR
jgi:photosystem II stability/assembly factor-like uncharacterized protein